jgi:uncharacterized membrane protein (DUF106 family)
MAAELLGIKLIYPAAAFMVFGLSVIVSLLSSAVHRVLVDRKKMDAVRERMESHQKEFLEAQKANDQKRVAKLEKEQEEIMGLVKDNMLTSMKPALFTMPVFLVLIWWLGGNYGSLGPIVDMPFGIPFLTKATATMGVVNGMDWFAVYILIAISASLILELVLGRLRK